MEGLERQIRTWCEGSENYCGIRFISFTENEVNLTIDSASIKIFIPMEESSMGVSIYSIKICTDVCDALFLLKACFLDDLECTMNGTSIHRVLTTLASIYMDLKKLPSRQGEFGGINEKPVPYVQDDDILISKIIAAAKTENAELLRKMLGEHWQSKSKSYEDTTSFDCGWRSKFPQQLARPRNPGFHMCDDAPLDPCAFQQDILLTTSLFRADQNESSDSEDGDLLHQLEQTYNHNTTVQSLVEMGFPEDQVRLAVKAAKGDANQAVEFLMSGVPEHNFAQIGSPPNRKQEINDAEFERVFCFSGPRNDEDTNDLTDEFEIVDDIVVASKNGDIDSVQNIFRVNPKRGFGHSKGPWRAAYMGWTSLHWAAYNGHKNLLAVLTSTALACNSPEVINEQASVSAGFGTMVSWAPIHAAASTGKDGCIAVLVEAGAQLDLKEAPQKKTALHLAAERGHATVIHALASAGASLNMKAVHGNTALHLAAYHGHHDVVTALMKAGAALDTKNKSGFTALALAEKRGHESIRKMLEDRPELITLEESLLLRKNEQINRCELQMEELIGEGSFGIVRKAYWRGMKVAVKEFKIFLDGSFVAGSSQEKIQEELRQEAKFLSRVCNHSCVVQFIGICLSPGPAVITRFMSNGSVEDMLIKKQQSVERSLLLRMALEAAQGLQHLHREGVIHRDLAARNLLVDEYFHVQVGDFGFARVKQGDSEFYTSTNIAPVKWSAPEYLKRLVYSESSDVFSFGVVLYEIFVQQSPWKGLSNQEVLELVVNRSERMPLPVDMDSELQTVINHCWAHDPEQRPKVQEILKFLHDKMASSQEITRGEEELQSNDGCASNYENFFHESDCFLPEAELIAQAGSHLQDSDVIECGTSEAGSSQRIYKKMKPQRT